MFNPNLPSNNAEEPATLKNIISQITSPPPFIDESDFQSATDIVKVERIQQFIKEQKSLYEVDKGRVKLEFRRIESTTELSFSQATAILEKYGQTSHTACISLLEQRIQKLNSILADLKKYLSTK